MSRTASLVAAVVIATLIGSWWGSSPNSPVVVAQDGAARAGGIGLEIDPGTWEIFSCNASGVRTDSIPIAMVHRHDDWEAWVTKSSLRFPLQENVQFARSASQGDWETQEEAVGGLVMRMTKAGRSSLSTNIVELADIATDMPANASVLGTYDVHAMLSLAAGPFVGAAHIRQVGSSYYEAWCLSPGLAFPVAINFVALWKDQSSGDLKDPFRTTAVADLEGEMVDYVKNRLSPSFNMVRVSELP